LDDCLYVNTTWTLKFIRIQYQESKLIKPEASSTAKPPADLPSYTANEPGTMCRSPTAPDPPAILLEP